MFSLINSLYTVRSIDLLIGGLVSWLSFGKLDGIAYINLQFNSKFKRKKSSFGKGQNFQTNV